MDTVSVRVEDPPAGPGIDSSITASIAAPDTASDATSMAAVLSDGGWLIREPPSRQATPDRERLLLRALVDACRDHREAPVSWWVDPASARTDATARALDLHLTRELLQMRRPPTPAPSGRLATRPFEPGRDDRAWLEVNNAAFSWHEDQHDWTLEDLRRRLAEPWFDAEGFLLHEREGRLAAFCWTKEHRSVEPPLGEIYVIAVHPDFHGHGLGRAMTLAGLEHLAERGLPIGMLFVEADNEPAIHVYSSLGFTVHHRVRRYTTRPFGPAHDGIGPRRAQSTPSSDPTA